VVDESPPFPYQTLDANIPIVDRLFSFAHSLILAGISHYLKSPCIVFATFVLSYRFKSIFERIFGFQFFHQFFLVNLDTFRNVRLEKSQPTVFKNILRVVNPVLKAR
jgi:hypothetical protein